MGAHPGQNRSRMYLWTGRHCIDNEFAPVLIDLDSSQFATEPANLDSCNSCMHILHEPEGKTMANHDRLQLGWTAILFLWGSQKTD